jgi:hypothetical protein
VTIAADGTATVTVNTSATILGGPDQSLTLTVNNNPSAADTIAIHEAQQTVTSAASVNEGSTIDFTVHTLSTGGINPAQFAGEERSSILAMAVALASPCTSLRSFARHRCQA